MIDWDEDVSSPSLGVEDTSRMAAHDGVLDRITWSLSSWPHLGSLVREIGLDCVVEESFALRPGLLSLFRCCPGVNEVVLDAVNPSQLEDFRGALHSCGIKLRRLALAYHGYLSEQAVAGIARLLRSHRELVHLGLESLPTCTRPSPPPSFGLPSLCANNEGADFLAYLLDAAFATLTSLYLNIKRRQSSLSLSAFVHLTTLFINLIAPTAILNDSNLALCTSLSSLAVIFKYPLPSTVDPLAPLPPLPHHLPSTTTLSLSPPSSTSSTLPNPRTYAKFAFRSTRRAGATSRRGGSRRSRGC